VAIEKLDPSLVFTFLFGSDAFNDLVGRLALVTQMLVAGDQTAKKTTTTTLQSQLLELERRRVVRLALKLRDRIQKFVDGGTETARAEWKAEAERLVDVRYGQELLNTVGSTYRFVATQCIGTLLFLLLLLLFAFALSHCAYVPYKEGRLLVFPVTDQFFGRSVPYCRTNKSIFMLLFQQ